MTSSTTDLALLVGRILVASLFILEGWSKLNGYAGAVGYMQKFGLPAFLLAPTIALELLGGLALLAGLQTRGLALVFALFCIAAALIFHWNFANRGEVLHFEKDLALAGGFLAFFIAGGGRWSVDAMWGRNASRG